MPSYTDNPIAQQILAQARRTGADPYTMLATAVVESGLNPQAVGDNGTSYGLYQMHVGGAGGRSHDEARRYLNPSASIENRARAFRGGAGGEWAASVQRPADAAGYARKVNAVIAQLRKGGGLPKGVLNAPVTSAGGGGGVAPGVDGSRKALALSMLFSDDDPEFGNMLAASALRRGDSESSLASVPARGAASAPAGPSLLGGGKTLDQLSALAKRFGLPITSTTGGKHAPGSYHYSARAVDVGLGPGGKKLQQYARSHPGEFKEFFGPMPWHIKSGRIVNGAFPDHNDHYHAAR